MYIKMAADPEFGFKTKDGGILPSLCIIPDKTNTLVFQSYGVGEVWVNGDGWNGEFQINRSGAGHTSTWCIAYLMDNFYSALWHCNQIAKKNKCTLTCDDLAPLSKKWMPKAPDICWVSGCNPTLNVDGDNAAVVLPNFAEDIIKWGAPLGGHVHIIDNILGRNKEKNAKEFVKLAAFVAVLPMALLGWNDKRRDRFKLLGVGNYRLPSHGGIELKDFGAGCLQSIVHAAAQFGFVRTAASIFGGKTHAEIKKMFKYEELRDAILAGDLDKMTDIWNKVRDIIVRSGITDDGSPYFNRCTTFQFFVENPDVLPQSINDGWNLDCGFITEEHARGYCSHAHAIIGEDGDHMMKTSKDKIADNSKRFKAWMK